jgi:hypothetical protein
MVSASQSTNPLGAQVIMDFGNPGIITGKARTVLSGGDLVQIFSGTASLTGSSASTFQNADIIFQKAEDTKLFAGIVVQNTGSNQYAPVATEGFYLMRAAGVVSGGALVGHNSSGNVTNWIGNISGTNIIEDTIVGRAFQSIPSGTNSYGVIKLW